MGTLQLPDAFQESYLDFKSYPCNLVLKGTTTYPTALKAYKSRLDSGQSDIFIENEAEVEIPFRDLHTASGEEELEKCNIHTSGKLTSWLGVETTVDPFDPKRLMVLARKRDPKCRFIYIYGEHSRAHLKITKDMLAMILTYYQVMPAYLDFISVFGAQSEPHDLRFTGFREQITLTDPARGPMVPSLGRSGRQYQLCYNLKCVTLKLEDKANFKLNEWSIRQAAIHHQFDITEGTTLWIVTKGNLDIQERFKELTGKTGRPEDKAFGTVKECFRSSLAAHLLYCHWSTEDWRWYIRWLERVIEEETTMAVLGPRGPGYAHQYYIPRNLQDLQRWEDKTNEVIMVLEANVDVMSSLCRFYDRLKDNRDFSLRGDCSDEIISFVSQVDDMISNFKMQIARARLLVKITTDRKALVMQHLQSQATERMEGLNENLKKEAIVVRIITIVTLIYLPATFVSTFFSTDVVKFQNGNGESGDGAFSPVALKRWLQVTLPLTALTLLIAYVSLQMTDKKMKGQGDSMKKRKWYTKTMESKPPLLPMHKEHTIT